MTTKQEETRTELLVPEVLTDEHHEALAASWEMPAYERPEAASAKGSRTALIAALVSGALGLALGMGVGYVIRGESVQVAEPFVVTSVNGPVDANGMNLGRRVPPMETALPIGLTVGGPVDANGMNLGRRVPPLETPAPVEIPEHVTVDANGMNLGRRVPPFEA